VDPTELERLTHCWIVGDAGRSPALLLEWRWLRDRWKARVVRGCLVDDKWGWSRGGLPAKQLDQA
jgi:hypothetical protein